MVSYAHTNSFLTSHTIVGLSYTISDQTELKVRNNSFIINAGDNRTCFEIEAVDDDLIEGTEVVNVTVIPLDPNDSVMDGITSVTIVDNDST